MHSTAYCCQSACQMHHRVRFLIEGLLLHEACQGQSLERSADVSEHS